MRRSIVAMVLATMTLGLVMSADNAEARRRKPRCPSQKWDLKISVPIEKDGKRVRVQIEKVSARVRGYSNDRAIAHYNGGVFWGEEKLDGTADFNLKCHLRRRLRVHGRCLHQDPVTREWTRQPEFKKNTGYAGRGSFDFGTLRLCD